MDSIDHILTSIFHLERFRPHQREIIEDVIARHDVVCVMPTGAGKSLCFQLPATAFRGLTIIVSPLISLMADQVQHLRKLRIPAMYLNSSLPADAQRQVMARIREGFRGLLYVAPERFAAPAFERLLPQLKPNLFVVDEAHCVSFWGHDFRPEYMRLAEVRRQLGEPVTVALTATATPQVRKDIVTMLGLKSPKLHVTGFDRPNLTYACMRFKYDDEKDAALLRFLRGRAGSGIIYCSTRRAVEELAALLEEKFPGRTVCGYHAGMAQEARHSSQSAFMQDPQAIVVATNAFGMGINKPDIRFVLHYNLPGSVEAYYQEAGRAGRDGKPANCVLYFGGRDLRTQQFFIDKIGDSNPALGDDAVERLQRNARRKLSLMLDYASMPLCRRRQILDYFGEKTAITNCGCDICQHSTLHRYSPDRPARSPQRYDSRRGALRTTPEVVSPGPVSPARAGVARGGVIAGSPVRAGVVAPGSRPAGPVSNSSQFTSGSSSRRASPVSPQPVASPEAPLDTAAAVRFERLRAVRLKLATDQNVPAFCIMHDRVLRELARKAPQSIEEMMTIKGIGPAKAEKFGKAFLAALRDS
jgi:ATP-dependent DNA helicase RecQ